MPQVFLWYCIINLKNCMIFQYFISPYYCNAVGAIHTINNYYFTCLNTDFFFFKVLYQISLICAIFCPPNSVPKSDPFSHETHNKRQLSIQTVTYFHLCHSIFKCVKMILLRHTGNQNKPLFSRQSNESMTKPEIIPEQHVWFCIWTDHSERV